MACTGWMSPIPFRVGGRGHATIQGFYNSMRSNRTAALQGAKNVTEVDIENKVAARMLAVAWRETNRRVNQRDPLKLSFARRPVKLPGSDVTELLSPLERQERFLGLTPETTQSYQDRRAAVAARVASAASSARAQVSTAMSAIFGPWFKGVFENHIGDVDYAGKAPVGQVHAYWATSSFTFSSTYPGEYDAARPWTTGLAIINIGIQPPAATAQSDIDAKTTKALDTLDAMLPAWMSAAVSQWAPGQTTPGFFLGVSYLGLTAL